MPPIRRAVARTSICLRRRAREGAADGGGLLAGADMEGQGALLGAGEREAHRGAGGACGEEGNIAVVRKENAFGDGEAEAGAVGAAGEE